MSDLHEMDTDDQWEPSALELMIKSAGDYVHVSDDLRPQVLEAALERQQVTVVRRRIGWSVAATILLLSMSVRGLCASGSSEDFGSPSSLEIQQTAIQYAADTNTSPDWALYQAFDELRRSNAQKLRESLH